jgi:hypothetical protein
VGCVPCRSPAVLLCTPHVSPRRSISAEPAARVRAVLVGALLLGLAACPVGGLVEPGTGGGDEGSDYPPASVYELDPEFAGEWVGDVGGSNGTLTIGKLDQNSYFGSFVTDDGAVEYTLLLQHSYVTTAEGGEVPSNRTTFTWQDGLGSRGKGWLLINREDTAITGSFGYGQATSGLGDWSFIRYDE